VPEQIVCELAGRLVVRAIDFQRPAVELCIEIPSATGYDSYRLASRRWNACTTCEPYGIDLGEGLGAALEVIDHPAQGPGMPHPASSAKRQSEFGRRHTSLLNGGRKNPGCYLAPPRPCGRADECRAQRLTAWRPVCRVRGMPRLVNPHPGQCWSLAPGRDDHVTQAVFDAPYAVECRGGSSGEIRARASVQEASPPGLTHGERPAVQDDDTRAPGLPSISTYPMAHCPAVVPDFAKLCAGDDVVLPPSKVDQRALVHWPSPAAAALWNGPSSPAKARYGIDRPMVADRSPFFGRFGRPSARPRAHRWNVVHTPPLAGRCACNEVAIAWALLPPWITSPPGISPTYEPRTADHRAARARRRRGTSPRSPAPAGAVAARSRSTESPVA
jgi:hypothetical protein